MAYKASAHAVYDLKYHIVWAPKYRRDILVGEVAQTVQQLFQQIAEAYEIEIDTIMPRQGWCKFSRAFLPGNCLPASRGYAGDSGAGNSGKMAILCVP